MISVREALETILGETSPLDHAEVDLFGALGRVLAEDVAALRPNPPWDNSAMDGYAVRTEDLSGAGPDNPGELKVIYDLPAGQVPRGPVEKGQAVRIMTGAPVPEGADAVVMVERTEQKGSEGVLIKHEPGAGDNIRREGKDFEPGDVVIKAGSVVRPAEVSVLATVGAAKLKVFRRPRVAVLSTGDELSPIGETPAPGKIPDSNGYTLSALVTEAGAEAVHLGIARDNPESLREKLRAASEADIIVSSGGVSVGDYDFVKEVLEELGSEMRFWKVAIKPGKPLAYGVIGGKPAFGLPGNPVSSMVVFEQFVRPVLLKMAGRTEAFRMTFPAHLTEDLKSKPGRMTFFRGLMRASTDGFIATPLKGQGSGTVSTTVKANCYIIVPEDCEGYQAGDTVRVQPFDDSVLASDTPGY